MPLKRGLTPKWRKMYRGEIYYFRGEYEEALRQWKAKELELNRAGELTPGEILGVHAAQLEIAAHENKGRNR